MTPEEITIRYRGPKPRGEDKLEWRWRQRGRQWPRDSYYLSIDVETRKFSLARVDKASIRYRSVGHIITDPNLIHAFRSLLGPEDIARCMVAHFNSEKSHA